VSDIHLPGNPLLTARFALSGLRSVNHLVETKFRSSRTRALFAGLAAHAGIPLENPATAAFGIVLATLAHAVGFPMGRAGSQKLADALAACFLQQGGEIRTGRPIQSMRMLPEAKYYFFDVTPRQILGIEGLGLSEGYRQRLSRFRYGPDACKVPR
jgi:phytoene dehydrogenase-like protein